MSLNFEEEEESEELPSQQHKKMQTPRDPQRQSLANRFIERITTGQEPLSQLCSVLKARGFLLEDKNEPDYNPEHIYLSDNSHANDALHLDNLLRENEIGYIFSDDSPYRNWEYQDQRIPLPLRRWEVFVSGEIKQESLVNLFLHRRSFEAGPSCRLEGYDQFNDFKKHEYGDKIETILLDIYIARLVKTLNAIGITTKYSCDGNVGGPHRRECSAFIQLYTLYDSVWFAILMDEFVLSERRLKHSWRIGIDDQLNMLIITPQRLGWLDMYLEIQEVTEILYDNRIKLRLYKQKIFNEISFEDFISWSEDKFRRSSFFYINFLSGLYYHLSQKIWKEKSEQKKERASGDDDPKRPTQRISLF
jgi:hypothetical protein